MTKKSDRHESRLLVAARSYKGLSQAQCARKLGISLQALVDLERGRIQPTLEWIDHACERIMHGEEVDSQE